MFICYKTYYITNCKSTVTNRMCIFFPYYIIKSKDLADQNNPRNIFQTVQ